MHFLIKIKKAGTAPAIYDAVLEIVQQRYFHFYPPPEPPTILYAVTESGNLWFSKTLAVSDQDWLKRQQYSFHTACQKAIQEALYHFLPPEHRHKLRGVTENADKVEVTQESLLEQITTLLTQPVDKLDQANYGFAVFIRRLQSFPAFAQSLNGTFPFCGELLSPELYSAFDLTGQQLAATGEELAVVKVE